MDEERTDPRLPLLREVWIDWIGQMCAALFWLVSVLAHGRYDAHDVLQLLAAAAWVVANLGRVNFLRAFTQYTMASRRRTGHAALAAAPAEDRTSGGATRASRVRFVL